MPQQFGDNLKKCIITSNKKLLNQIYKSCCGHKQFKPKTFKNILQKPVSEMCTDLHFMFTSFAACNSFINKLWMGQKTYYIKTIPFFAFAWRDYLSEQEMIVITYHIVNSVNNLDLQYSFLCYKILIWTSYF